MLRLPTKKLAGRADPERLARIVAMIEATATHELPDLDDAAPPRRRALPRHGPVDPRRFAGTVFDAYERAVRREYGWVEEPAWRAGRGAVLRNFLPRPHIFHTDEFRRRFEQQARRNMARSLKSLGQ